MCIKTTGFETLKSDLKVWKVCRLGKGDWFLSYFPPSWRASQGTPWDSEFQANNIWQALSVHNGSEGMTKRYYVGRTHRSKDPGMYCFRTYDHARQFIERGISEKVILECTIPARTRVVYGSYDGGDTVVTPTLYVDKLLHRFMWMYSYEHPEGRIGWVDLVATST